MNFTNLPRALEGKREWGGVRGRCYKEPSFPHQPPTGRREETAWEQGSLGAEVRRGSRREETLEFLQSGRQYPNSSGILKQKTLGQSGWRWAGTHRIKGL